MVSIDYKYYNLLMEIVQLEEKEYEENKNFLTLEQEIDYSKIKCIKDCLYKSENKNEITIWCVGLYDIIQFVNYAINYCDSIDKKECDDFLDYLQKLNVQ